jgi:hypothetical protein
LLVKINEDSVQFPETGQVTIFQKYKHSTPAIIVRTADSMSFTNPLFDSITGRFDPDQPLQSRMNKVIPTMSLKNVSQLQPLSSSTYKLDRTRTKSKKLGAFLEFQQKSMVDAFIHNEDNKDNLDGTMNLTLLMEQSICHSLTNRKVHTASDNNPILVNYANKNNDCWTIKRDDNKNTNTVVYMNTSITHYTPHPTSDYDVRLSTDGREVSIFQWNETLKTMQFDLYHTRELLEFNPQTLGETNFQSFAIQPPFTIQPFAIQPFEKRQFSYWPNIDIQHYSVTWIHGYWIIIFSRVRSLRSDVVLCYDTNGTHLSTIPIIGTIKVHSIYEGQSIETSKLAFWIVANPGSKYISIWKLSDFVRVLPPIPVTIKEEDEEESDGNWKSHKDIFYHRYSKNRITSIFIDVPKRYDTVSSYWSNESTLVVSVANWIINSPIYDYHLKSRLFYIRLSSLSTTITPTTLSTIETPTTLSTIPQICMQAIFGDYHPFHRTNNCYIFHEIRLQLPKCSPGYARLVSTQSSHREMTHYELEYLVTFVIENSDLFKSLSIPPLIVLVFAYVVH